MHIRDMRPEDVPEVVRIERLSFGAPWTETSFHSEIHNSRSTARVAELDDAISGYICVRRILDECHLHDLAVHPLYRRCGIAKVLLDDVTGKMKAEGVRAMYLEVRVSNEPARRFYEKCGFRMVGTRKRYYVSPVEDAAILMLEW